MKRLHLVLLGGGAVSLALFGWACSQGEVTSVVPTYDASEPYDDLDAGPRGDGSIEIPQDSGPLKKDASCSDYSLQGAEKCGAMPFGALTVPFSAVDPGDGGGYQGGPLVPGIYDATLAERASGLSGSWRETFVLGCDGKFTRTRQIDTGSGPGNVSHRSGTLTMNGATGVFTYTCYYSGDAGPLDAGVDNLPSEFIKGGDGKYLFRYGVTGIRITLKRRDD
ncbi:MAG: hypothetical protein U0174_15415 [Polyangiaceae bacterium]